MPPLPAPGTNPYHVGDIVGNWRWTGVGWQDAGGQSKGGGGGGVDDIINNAISSLSGIFPQKVTPFEQVDPFQFDKELAKQAATAEYDPYYQQLLSDYTKGAQTTISRSKEDLTKTLQQLQQGKDYYMGTEGRMLDSALKQTNNGYAGRGLFFSGARQGDINKIQEQYNAETGNYNQQYTNNVAGANQAAARTQEDVNTAQSQYNRDTGQAEKSAIAQGVLQRQTEAQQQYESARQAYYNAAQYGGQGSASDVLKNLPKYSY